MKELIAVVAIVMLSLGIFLLVPDVDAERTPVPSTLQARSALEQIGTATQTRYDRLEIDGVEIFYREAGSRDAPTLVLLHGFPTSSHMYRNLIENLSDQFHLIAPDYPGFGNSSMPDVDEYEYTFDQLSISIEKFIDAKGIDRFSIYLQDYGAPVGLRIAARNPHRIEGLIVQNGNAYEEGLREFWDPLRTYWSDPSPAHADQLRPFFELDATIWQFTHGVRDVSVISPDNWIVAQVALDRPGNDEIQLALFYDYQNNIPLYADWQAYFRKYQPPTLIVWGQNDVIFPVEGAYPFQRDLENLEFHLLDTGHFALEEDGQLIADEIRDFLSNINP